MNRPPLRPGYYPSLQRPYRPPARMMHPPMQRPFRPYRPEGYMPYNGQHPGFAPEGQQDMRFRPEYNVRYRPETDVRLRPMDPRPEQEPLEPQAPRLPQQQYAPQPYAPTSPPSHRGSIDSNSSRQYDLGQYNLGQSNARKDADNVSIQSSATNQTVNTAQVKEVLMPYTDLEEYRQHVKKSDDPKMQLDFAKQLIAVAEEMRVNPKGLDPKKIKKNRDVLHAEAVKWIKKAASGSLLGKPGYPDAIFMLADAYGNGNLGLAIDHDRAFSLYAQAAKQNHLASIYRYGVCYEVGAGTKRDNARAIQFYKKAAMMGDTAAMFKVGMILLNGTLGHQKNPREGINWLKRASSQADGSTPHAVYELAVLYEGVDPEMGKFLVPDPVYASELYLKSAQLGYAPGQYRLGLAYEYGQLSLPIDPRRSIAWYSKAAEQGDPEAELCLAGWYLTGAEGVLPRNDYESYLWTHKAASKGLAKAEYCMGHFLETGIGVRMDPEQAFDEARRWYQRAAGQGNKRAMQRLNEMHAGVGPRLIRTTDWRLEPDTRNGECAIM
ncbi:hypothetical protein EDD86DRAFT_197936 [Gorgonomyces haynaldii]|nr:hypothetical protein EDD86DRAFT_197936 [Gorgonomyces haynaldii]